MRLAIRSTAKKLFVAMLLFNIPIVTVYLANMWTMQTYDSDKTPAECLDLSLRLQQLEYPLLCMFTTFKPRVEKIPVSPVSSRTNSHKTAAAVAVKKFSTQMPNALDDVIKV